MVASSADATLATSLSAGGGGTTPVAGAAQNRAQPLLTPALLAQQLPPLKPFSGEEREEGEEISDWLDRFQMIAEVCHWNQQAKLVNLATRLSGQAYAFYQSCSSQQKTNYSALVSALTKRFTPVRIQSVESSLFHEHKQRETESVDEYAQALRSLFHRAYPHTQQSSREAEDMGKAVLASQFISGLRPAVKRKVTGSEGDFQQLLVKARFEEARLKELSAPNKTNGNKAPGGASQLKPHEGKPTEGGLKPSKPADLSRQGLFRGRPGGSSGGPRCYHCGRLGHISRDCRQRSSAPVETRVQSGPTVLRPQGGNVAAIGANETVATE